MRESRTSALCVFAREKRPVCSFCAAKSSAGVNNNAAGVISCPRLRRHTHLAQKLGPSMGSVQQIAIFLSWNDLFMIFCRIQTGLNADFYKTLDFLIIKTIRFKKNKTHFFTNFAYK